MKAFEHKEKAQRKITKKEHKGKAQVLVKSDRKIPIPQKS